MVPGSDPKTVIMSLVPGSDPETVPVHICTIAKQMIGCNINR